MQQGLIAQGIEKARIMMEDKSTTTHENYCFLKKLIPDTAASGLIVSNDFHIYRAVEMAKRRLGHEGIARQEHQKCHC